MRFVGNFNISMQARQKLSLTIKEGRTALYDGNGVGALQKAEEASEIASELQDKRASRAVSRLRANALNNVSILLLLVSLPSPPIWICQSSSWTSRDL